MNKNYQILLFYKYVNIADPEAEMNRQKELCKKLNLKCRTIVAEEGINGTLEGLVEDTEKYIEKMEADEKFKGMHYKKSKGYGAAFPKVNVKVREEIVSLRLGEQDLDPNEVTGKYITADELHNLYENGDEEFYVVDMRNDYEQKVGHFRNAILMPMANFRELPEIMDTIESIKHKKVITTCTGGIRCEKASGFLVEQGFTNVYQLWGGMQTYMEKYPDGHFLGKLYVFDGRITWAPEGYNQDIILSNCKKCGKPSDTYVDCAYLHCKGHRHFICCDECLTENGLAFCCDECKVRAEHEEKVFVRG